MIASAAHLFPLHCRQDGSRCGLTALASQLQPHRSVVRFRGPLLSSQWQSLWCEPDFEHRGSASPSSAVLGRASPRAGTGAGSASGKYIYIYIYIYGSNVFPVTRRLMGKNRIVCYRRYELSRCSSVNSSSSNHLLQPLLKTNNYLQRPLLGRRLNTDTRPPCWAADIIHEPRAAK